MLVALPLGAEVVTSPDGALSVELRLDDGRLSYEVRRGGQVVLESSPLGLVCADGAFSGSLAAGAVERRLVDERYTLPLGKVREVHHVANEMTSAFANDKGETIEVVFRVSDRDVAFRYRLSGGERQRVVVERELSGFNFPADATAYLAPQARWGGGFAATKPSYEESYMVGVPVGTPSGTDLGFTFPALFRVGEAGWALVSETGVTGNYVGSRLSDPTEDGLYTIAFPDAAENAGVGDATVAASLPIKTPWRTLTVGDLAAIVESTAATDLVAPLYAASREYKPGRAVWSWILWQDGSMNEADQRTYIDLAARLGYDYILIDALWDANIGRGRMAELVAYARGKGVGVFLWYNSNGAWNDAPQSPRDCLDQAPARRREMEWMRSIGVEGIKVDFFGGDKQVTMRLYEDILTDADEHGLMVVFHGATLPRGWERMYPNFVSSEAVLASENLVFSQGFADGEAHISTLYPYIRNAVAPMDFGPALLNRRFWRGGEAGNFRRTSVAFQLATSVLYQTPVQFFGVTPESLDEQPAFVFDFLREVPTTWDETRFVGGTPGESVAIARRSGGRWYLAATNGGPAPLTVHLRFTPLAGRELTFIGDAPDLGAEKNTLTVGPDGEIVLTLQKGGGAVLFE